MSRAAITFVPTGWKGCVQSSDATSPAICVPLRIHASGRPDEVDMSALVDAMSWCNDAGLPLRVWLRLSCRLRSVLSMPRKWFSTTTIE